MTSSDIDREIALYDDVKSMYGVLLNEFAQDDALIRGEIGSEIIPDGWEDEGLEVTVPPTAYNAVENAADHILAYPRISVPVRPTETEIEKQREIAENRRAFHELWWLRCFEEDGDPLGRGKKSLVKGKLVLKKSLRWDLLPQLPDEPTNAQRMAYRREIERTAKQDWIWRLEVVPKETVFEDPAKPWNPDWVFESYETTAVEARTRFYGHERLMERLRDLSPTAKVTYTEYWLRPGRSAEYPRGRYIQWVERERVHEGDNPYHWQVSEERFDGYVPYVILDPGWGDVSAGNKPEDRYVSIVRPLRSVAKAETRFLTEMESYLRLYVWPHLITKNMPDLEDGEKQIRLGPGGHTNLTEDQEADVLKWGELPVSLLQGMDRVNGYADEASRFGVLGGTPQRGVDTATEADQNVRNAATKLSGPVRALQRAVMRINQWVLQDIEKVLEAPVTLYGATQHGPAEVTLKPSDIGGYYFTRVEMETTDEAALNLRNARTWSDLAQRLPISFRTAMEKAGVPNPSAEMDERMLENIEQSPQALQVLLLTMLGGLGQHGQMVQQAFASSLVPAQGQAGGQGGPTPQGAQPAAPNTAAQATVQGARDQAIADQPERTLY